MAAGNFKSHPFFTIGHSTRPIADFVALLRQADVRLLVDVRTVPRSRTNPQYNAEVLSESLALYAIEWERIGALGGLRGKQAGVPPRVNAFWENDSFHNYADYAMSDAFRAGLARLLELGHTGRCAVMCAEAVWWRCHRRIIADYLIAAGETVFHILGPNHTELARMTPAAKTGAHATLNYPPIATAE
jgi:uncharacterized protein (DUF488 family)